MRIPQTRDGEGGASAPGLRLIQGLARGGWQARWLELSSAVVVAVVLIICAGQLWTAPLLLGPLRGLGDRDDVGDLLFLQRGERGARGAHGRDHDDRHYRGDGQPVR